MYHNAGADGYGSSSYIDTTILRDYDTSNGWTGAANGSFETRAYYCHNWRGDVVNRISDAGWMVESVRYSPYGIPYGIPQCDSNGDGTVDSTDYSNANTWWGTSKPTVDANLDGTIDSTDTTQVILVWGTTLGWGKLSTGGAAGGNRRGYAGYEFDPALAYSMWHVRYRVLNSDLGRWTIRDAIDVSDTYNLYTYAGDDPTVRIDVSGQCSTGCGVASSLLGGARDLLGRIEKCCDNRCKNSPVDTLGKTTCCGEQGLPFPVICVCQDHIRSQYSANGIGCFYQQFFKCVAKHESMHICHMRCPLDALTGQHVPEWVGMCDQICSELDAYEQERACVMNIHCGSCLNQNACLQQISLRIMDIDNHIAEYQQRCDDCKAECRKCPDKPCVSPPCQPLEF